MPHWGFVLMLFDNLDLSRVGPVCASRVLEDQEIIAAVDGVNLVKVRDGKFTHVRAYFDPTQFPQPGSR
jgi:hypothetical protein